MVRAEVLGALALGLTLSGFADTGQGEAASVRLPAVSGQWYPAAKEELASAVDGLLKAQPAVRIPGRIRALIAPHAGYRFSGSIAAQGFAQIPRDVVRVVILAPAHTVRMRGGGSILDVESYRTPLGDIPVASVAAKLREEHGFLDSHARVHQKEWSLEVMLPFLQRRLERFELVPIVLGYGFDAARMAEALQPVVAGRKTLVVASSDLSHDKSYEQAVAADHDCVRSVLAHDVAGLEARELCGRDPVKVLVELAKLNAWFPTLIDYKNSGDTTGDTGGRIVGYACIGFTAIRERGGKAGDDPAAPSTDAAVPGASRLSYEGERFSAGEQRLLLHLARRSIEAALAREEQPALPMYSDTLTEKLGCFVTLHKDGALRGCIGNIFPASELAQAVQTNALSAAFRDQRFPAVTASELPELKIEISALTAPGELEYRDAGDLLRQLRPGVHGVVISQGERKRSTYLPQVWEQIPDPVCFLSRLCHKGKMATDAWRDPGTTTVQVYEAYAFEEE